MILIKAAVGGFFTTLKSVDAQKTDTATTVKAIEVKFEETSDASTQVIEHESDSPATPKLVDRSKWVGLEFLSNRYICALERVHLCNLFPCDAQISSWDPFGVFTGACRLAEAALQHDVNFTEFHSRILATACLTIAMKHAKSCSVSRLNSFISSGNGTTTMYFCVFSKMEPSSSIEFNARLLYERIEHAEGQIIAKLSSHLFRLLVLNPPTVVELLVDSLLNEGIQSRDATICAIRNIASRLTMATHLNHDKGTELVRRSRLDHTNDVVASAILLVAVEAMSTFDKNNLVNYDLVKYCLQLDGVVVELALALISANVRAEPLSVSRSMKGRDRAILNLLGVSTLTRVHMSLTAMRRRLI